MAAWVVDGWLNAWTLSLYVQDAKGHLIFWIFKESKGSLRSCLQIENVCWREKRLRTLCWTYEPGRRSEGTGWTWAHSRFYSQFPHWRWVRQISRNSPGTQRTSTTTRWSIAPEPARLLQKPGRWRSTRTRRLLPAAPWNTPPSHRCCAFISAETLCHTYCSRPLDIRRGVTSSLPWVCQKHIFILTGLTPQIVYSTFKLFYKDLLLNKWGIKQFKKHFLQGKTRLSLPSGWLYIFHSIICSWPLSKHTQKKKVRHQQFSITVRFVHKNTHLSHLEPLCEEHLLWDKITNSDLKI